MDTIAKCLQESIPEFEDEIFLLNDDMACNPEIGGTERKSSQNIVNLLRSHGLEVEYPYAGLDTAFCAHINPGCSRRAALMVEYDALPEIGHACGHCASGSASILAGLCFLKNADKLDYGIDLVGTPDEELGAAKCYMVERGVFDNYDFAVLVHMSGKSDIRDKQIALDSLIIEFTGAPAHAAKAPETGRNALNAARLFFDATDMMRQHVRQDTRLHGFIRKGGVAANIVPDYASIEFIARSPKRSYLDGVTEWVKDCAKAAALATHTECKIHNARPSLSEIYVSQQGRELMGECFQELGEILPCDGEGEISGSSDVGNVDCVIPAFQPMMSIGKPYDVHTKEFACEMTTQETHQTIVRAAKWLILFVTKLYGDPERMLRIKKAHDEYRFGNVLTEKIKED